MNSCLLKSGFRLIPYYVEKKENSNLSPLDLERCLNSIKRLEQESLSHRLADNYSKKRLHLDKMHLYSLVYDEAKDEPVFFTGVQAVGKYSARVFSRYFMFPKYRTDPKSTSLFDKIDDFEVLKLDIERTKSKYPFIFWSRDKGAAFFRRLQQRREDIFSDWVVHEQKIELIYKDNFQGLLYLNLGSNKADFYIQSDLTFKPYH